MTKGGRKFLLISSLIYSAWSIYLHIHSPLHPFKCFKNTLLSTLFVDYLCQSIFLKKSLSFVHPYQWTDWSDNDTMEEAAILNQYWYEFIQIYIVGIFLLSSDLPFGRFTHIICTHAYCRPLIASINLYGCDKCFPPIHVRIYINAYSERREKERKKSMASITASELSLCWW